MVLLLISMRLIHKSFQKFSLDFSKLSQPITTEGNRNYKINTALPIDGYITSNADAPSVVIMIHQWWGFNKSISKTADLFSSQKLRVFVPDLYRGKPAVDAEDAGHKMSGLNWNQALADIQAIKQHFEADNKKVSITGFCMGGALSLASLASFKGWKAGAVYYGIPDLNIFRLDKIQSKVIAHFGQNDPLQGFSDAQSAKKLRNDAQANGYPIDVHIWDGASHAFCNQDSPYFHEQTRDKSFVLTKKLFEEGL